MDNIEKLRKEFEDECYDIALGCEEEGYPSHGSTYDLRVTALMETDYYKPLFEN